MIDAVRNKTRAQSPSGFVRKNVGLLATCQALLFINNITIISISALLGARLAKAASLSPSFATVPATFWVIGAAAAAMPAAALMKRIGRRDGFTVGPMLGLTGAAAVGAAIVLGNFYLLCAGTFIYGGYNGFAQQYRFAAADASPETFKAKAISYVLAGGLVGGLVGPTISQHTKDLFGVQLEFLGSIAVLCCLMVVVVVLLQRLDIPIAEAGAVDEVARPTRALVRQPKFFIGVISIALGYAVMNLLMVSTPLAMTAHCGHPYSAVASVIGFHVIGMFAPSLVTGTLMNRFGIVRIMFVGVALNFATVAVALSGVTVAHFWWALLLLGIGWNFLYIGGTALLTQTYRPAERARAQGISEVSTFMVMVLSSLTSGVLLEARGWTWLNYISAALVTLIGVALAWLAVQKPDRPETPNATATAT